MTIILLYTLFVGFAGSIAAGLLIIVVFALCLKRSTPWSWCCSSVLCVLLSAQMRLDSQQASLASKANGESMSTTYEQYFASMSHMAASTGFGLTGFVAGAVAIALLLRWLLNRKPRQSIVPPSPLPQHRD
ncbi:MAG: hypothetical protein VKI63_06360 [Cyanobium sp.]|nr:hypothetical protein [Cyanobium sp.]